jgi:hypothetical protein
MHTYIQVASAVSKASSNVQSVSMNASTCEEGFTSMMITATPIGDGDVTLVFPAGIAFDALDNFNEEDTTVIVAYDAGRPAPTVFNVQGSVDIVSDQRVYFRVVFSETVETIDWSSGAVQKRIIGGLSNAAGLSLQPLVTSNNEFQLNLAVTPRFEGPVSFAFPAALIGDAAGNLNTASPRASFYFACENNYYFNQAGTCVTCSDPDCMECPGDACILCYAPDVVNLQGVCAPECGPGALLASGRCIVNPLSTMEAMALQTGGANVSSTALAAGGRIDNVQAADGVSSVLIQGIGVSPLQADLNLAKTCVNASDPNSECTTAMGGVSFGVTAVLPDLNLADFFVLVSVSETPGAAGQAKANLIGKVGSQSRTSQSSANCVGGSSGLDCLLTKTFQHPSDRFTYNLSYIHPSSTGLAANLSADLKQVTGGTTNIRNVSTRCGPFIVSGNLTLHVSFINQLTSPEGYASTDSGDFEEATQFWQIPVKGTHTPCVQQDVELRLHSAFSAPPAVPAAHSIQVTPPPLLFLLLSHTCYLPLPPHLIGSS